jgi:hypothetical protein
MPDALPKVHFFPHSVIHGANTAGMSASLQLLKLITAAPTKPKRRRQAQAIRARWADDLVEWCRERGIGSDTAIAKFLGINRATLWRWKQGGPVSDANIATIVEKTGGDVDPRKQTRRRRAKPIDATQLGRWLKP